MRPSPTWAAAVMVAALLSAAAGCSSSNDRYGTAPSFLPSSAITPDSVLTGTVNRPALTSEGDAVRVRLAHGSALATVTGPVVPGEGLPHQNESTTCTWTIVLSDARGRVPIAVGDFSTLDHLGTVGHPRVLGGTGKPPALLEPGQRVRFQLRTVMRTGEGLIRWAPGSDHVLSSWDFTVETD